MMHFPAKIISKRLGQNFSGLRLRHHDVMFKTLRTNVAHELLQLRHARDGAVAKRLQLVIGQFTFADVSADFAIRIGGGDAPKSQRAGGRATVERAVGVLDTDDAAENRRGGNFDVGQE